MNHLFATHRWSMKPVNAAVLGGGLVIPAGVPAHTLMRRKLKDHLKRGLLLDPQMYLTTVDAARCAGACANLSSYPWFPVSERREYDSEQQLQREWKADARQFVASSWVGELPGDRAGIAIAARSTIDFQRTVGCSAVILPSPLTVELNTDYGVEAMWLDEGLRAARAAGDFPVFATVAISDTCTRPVNPWDNNLLTTIADQVSARQPDGVYIVLDQQSETGNYYITSRHTVGALLRLVNELKVAGVATVVVAYCGVAGLLTALAGADIWSTGWYRSERRLKISDLEDKEGGATVPAYYSHAAATEFHTKTDLDEVVKAGLLSRIADRTPYSEQLLKALGDKKPTSSVEPWRYRPNNRTASMSHFMEAVARETNAVSQLGNAGLIDYGERWLSEASAIAEEVRKIALSLARTDRRFNSRTELAHQQAWLAAFREFKNHVVT